MFDLIITDRIPEPKAAPVATTVCEPTPEPEAPC